MEKKEEKEDTDQRPPEITLSYPAFILVILGTAIMTTVSLAISTILTAKFMQWWN